MSAVMMRSFAKHMGIKWPPDVASMVSDGRGRRMRAVTWAEIHARRRQQQAQRMQRIVEPKEPRTVPCYVWTFFNRQSIPYHGWYCYVVTRAKEVAVNFRGFNEPLALSILREIPLGMLPLGDNFEAWMEKFAKTFPRTHRVDTRKAGTHPGWLTDHRTFSLLKPLHEEAAHG